MDKTIKSGMLKKHLTRSVLCLTLAAAFIPAFPQPAHADLLDVVQLELIQLQNGWSGMVQAAAHWFDKQIDTMLNDNINVNARNTSNLNALQTQAANKLDIAGTNACAIQHSSSVKDSDRSNARQMSAASAQANMNRPATPSANATELQNKCKLGMINTSNTLDSESAMYKRLFGTACPVPPTAAAKEGSDRNIASLLTPYQYYVPDTFPNQMTDANYQPLTPQTTTGSMGDYSQFIAAYTFCQNVTPTEPVVQQGGTTATTDDLIAGARRSEEAKMSVISACYDALWYRAAYPASNPITGHDYKGATTTMHAIQVARCTDDNSQNLLSDDQLALCKQNGRSNLQADHDKAYRLGAQSQYVVKVLPTLDLNTQVMATASAWEAEQRFDASLQQEYANVIASIGVAKGANVPGTSALGRQVSP